MTRAATKSASRKAAAPPPVRAKAVPPRIGIQIEPTASAARLNGRHDFVIRGRVISTAAIQEVAVFVDTVRVGRLVLGRQEPAAPLALPDGAQAIQHNFTFQVPAAPDAARAGLAFSIVARTFDDRGAQAACRLQTNAGTPDRASVTAGPVQPGVADTGLPPATVMYAERAAIDPGNRLHVQGWAVSRGQIAGIAVFVDDAQVGVAALGGPRSDVAAANPGYPDAGRSGFRLVMPIGALAAAAQRIRIQATTQTGATLEAALPVERVALQAAPDPAPAPAPAPAPLPAPAGDGRREIKMFCDTASLGTDGVLSVSGWAVSAVGIAAISVLIDGRPVADAEIGQVRLDVGDKHPGIPAARHSGYRLTAKAVDAPAGAYMVTIVARNGMDDVKEERRRVIAQRVARSAVAARPSGARPPPKPPATPAAKPFEFKLETPKLIGRTAPQAVAGRLTIAGWAVGRTGIAEIAVLVDDRPVGAAHHGIVRRDIGAAYTDWPESLRSGFAFHCPLHALPDGDHTVTLRIVGKGGETLTEAFRITVANGAGHPDVAGIRRRIPQAAAALYADTLQRLDWQPQFRILLCDAAGAAPDALRATLGSLAAQVYPHWRVDLVGDDPDLRAAVAAMVAALVADGVVTSGQIGLLGKAEAARAFAADKKPALVGVLCCGDRLGCDALAEFAVRSGIDRTAALLYADDLRVNPASGRTEAFFKPAFSPDLLLATNYIGRPWFATPALLARTGASPRSVQQAGAHDLLLHAAHLAGAAAIHAIPRLLCDSADAAPDAETDARAVAEAARRAGIAAAVEPGALPGTWRLRPHAGSTARVSVIVPTCGARGLFRTCLESVRTHTAHRNIEIVAIDNIPATQRADKAWLRTAADKVVAAPEAFNWARANNRGAGVADGAVLVFLNDDTEVTDPAWLDTLLAHAARPDIGIVGPRLLYPDGKVEQAGLFLAGSGPAGTALARPAFRFQDGAEPGYFGLARTPRNVIAVGGACMLMRQAVFAALGGFDETQGSLDADLDICLRAHAAGLLTVCTPDATLLHHEQASRAPLRETHDRERLTRAWPLRVAAGDPYHNPNLSPQSEDWRPDEEPARAVSAGHPLFRAADIRRILALLPGDAGACVAALPALRRLKAHFSHARLAVLAGPAAAGLAVLEPAIDDSIDLGFALGRREPRAEDLAGLAARLAPHGFDLAIDLHKRPETRPLLRCAGAPILAGFDHLGRFPWLDVALEWEGDRRLHRKHAHAGDDLLHLVDAVATAAAADRPTIAPEAVAALRARAALPATIRHLVDSPVVAVHAGAGGATTQWPAAHFAALIDLLVSRHRLRVLLLGSAEDTEIEAAILDAVAQADQVTPLAGKLSADALTAVIAASALFVGNDGDLKHVAAALGVPTVGVQSGTVDAAEWAPAGPRAVAVARAMTCGPCYLTRAEDCPRALACLRGLDPAAVFLTCEMLLGRPLPQPDLVGRASARPRKPPYSRRLLVASAD